MAPSPEVFDTALDQFHKIVKHWEEQASTDDGLSGSTTDALEPDEEFDSSDPHVDLTEFPHDGSSFEILIFIVLFPIRFIMQWTIGDVRTLDQEGNPTSTLGKAYLAITMCLVWLIIGSYAMVSSLEHLADLLNIPDSVVGVTVSAAGTSLPNYVASKVAAQKGFGVSLLSSSSSSLLRYLGLDSRPLIISSLFLFYRTWRSQMPLAVTRSTSW